MATRQGTEPGVLRDPDRLPRAAHRHTIRSPAAGYVTRLDAELVGRASVALGAGRARLDDQIDLSAGITIDRTLGDAVAAGDAILVLHYNDKNRLASAVQLAESAIAVAASAAPPPPLVLAWVHAGGETQYV
jgi:thymidine phosphorylase